MNRKAKFVTITEDNFKSVAGKVLKFFNGERGVDCWHQFDAKLRKHYKRELKLRDNTIVYISHKYYRPRAEISHTSSCVVLKLDTGNGSVVKIGDKISFLSNRIIIKTKGNFCGLGTLTEVYQYLD